VGQTRDCARHGATDAFDFQHDFGDFAQLGVRNFRREQLREAAFHFVHVRDFGFAEAEKFPIAAADDGRFLL